MRIYIKQANGRRFYIPIPLALAGASCNLAEFIIRKTERYIPEKEREYLQCIDFNQLALSLKELKQYKGLPLVEVKTKEGEEVNIVI